MSEKLDIPSSKTTPRCVMRCALRSNRGSSSTGWTAARRRCKHSKRMPSTWCSATCACNPWTAGVAGRDPQSPAATAGAADDRLRRRRQGGGRDARGACDFLMKPFEPQALLEHIKRYAVSAVGRRYHRRRSGDLQPAGAGRTGCRNRCDGDAVRRIRHRKGSVRALHPCALAARAPAFRRHQLCRDTREPARGNALRP